jgi:hypothetical protein
MSRMRWILVCLITMSLVFGQSACDRASNEGPLTQPHSKSDGLFRIVENGKHGYIDKAGRIGIPPQFDDAGPFSEGVVTVAIGEKIGYIDKSGKYIWAPTK